MSQKEPRTIAAADKVLRILKVLKGHSLDGLSNMEISKAVGESPSMVHRGLASLIQAGLARKLDNGRFAPGILLLQIAQAHANELESAALYMSELRQRVAAGAR